MQRIVPDNETTLQLIGASIIHDIKKTFAVLGRDTVFLAADDGCIQREHLERTGARCDGAAIESGGGIGSRFRTSNLQ